MIFTLLSLLFGLLLIYLEFFVPGGIFGVIGGGLTILSIFLFIYLVNPPSYAAIAYVIFIIFLLYLVIKWSLFSLKKKKNSFFLDTHQKGYSSSSHNKELFGKEGVVINDMRPSGFIDIDGENYQALSQGSFIAKGSRVKVIGFDGAALMVQKIGEK